ncbi:FAD/NAD(P)-binding domain-containing protein [Myriangium duriaei CBS 260.36]|uniref:FAD/NAD(P)-binding domain-containing protein n=1 Tax=Myriangium duriaei CBS 260.36 TaxID=1168546 RepID=A0A9P4MM44_9PEZI|nr:FAD/NAD(P)-binding domain-containing protein [Myriangium duriaei CBS 260.36]
MSDPKDFHVLVVGGGIGGLALAKSLELAGISYTLLESRDKIAPQVGASIGINPNGARILDQFGYFDEVLAAVEPLHSMTNRYGNHEKLGSPRDVPLIVAARTGYPLAFLDRHRFLEIMYNNLKDKTLVLLNKRVERIDTSETSVTVKCRDGSEYHGHVVIGCDGVNSPTRHELWRIADEQSPGYIPQKDKTAMTVEYKCLYGIATKTTGIDPPGHLYGGHGFDNSKLYIVNKGDRIYFFMIEKLDRIYGTQEIPKYTKEDAVQFAEQIRDWKMQHTTFGEVWKNVESYALVPLEEANYEKWAYGRIACAGDATTKMTPNSGAGGNASIESAAAVANELKRLVDHSHGIPSGDAIAAALVRYQDARLLRAHAIGKAANNVTRVHALKTWMHRFLVYYLVPRAGDLLTDMQCGFLTGAVMLDWLPPPKRSLTGTMPFNPQAGTGKQESRLWRLFLSLPLLAIFIAATQILNPTPLLPMLTSMHDNRQYEAGSFSFAVREKFTGIKWFDDIWRPLTICFMPSNFAVDELSYVQMNSFLTDVGIIYSIMLIESARRASALTVFKLPMLFGIFSQLAGGGMILPLYFYLAWWTCQIDHFKALDMRLTSMKYTSTVVVSMMVCYYLPLRMQFFASSFETRHLWNWVWQIFPITVAIMQRFLAATVAKDTITSDRLNRPLADLTTIQVQLAIPVLLSAVTWITTYFTAPFSMKEIFTPRTVALSSTDFNLGIRTLLQWDWVLIFGSAYIWLAYSFWDLKAAGMSHYSWIALLMLSFGLSGALGPGATFAIGWGYREYCLAYHKHKGAVVSAEVPAKGNVANGTANGVAKEIGNGHVKA